MDESAQGAAMDTASELREQGELRVDIYPEIARKMDKIFKHVDQRKARFIAILGTDEVAAGTVTLRNVATKTKETVPRSQAASFIRSCKMTSPSERVARSEGLQRAGVGPTRA